jgi:hypothetical protein
MSWLIRGKKNGKYVFVKLVDYKDGGTQHFVEEHTTV